MPLCLNSTSALCCRRTHLCLFDQHCLFILARPSRLSAFPAGRSLLDIRGLTLRVPSSGVTLVDGLTLSVIPGQSLLIMGPSGAGKTSILRQGKGVHAPL